MPARSVARATAGVLVIAASAAATTTASAASVQPVRLAFTAVAGAQPVSCGTPIAGLGTTSQTANLKDLRFFVSDVRLLRADGSSAPVKVKPNKDFRVASKAGSTTLIDLEDATGACAEEGTPATNALVLGTAPRGTYTGVRFSVGVPFALNHTNTAGAPGPLGLAAMAWSWQFGRKFMKIEFGDPKAAAGTGGGMKMAMDMTGTPAPTPTPATGAWAAPTSYVHIGSTGCTGNPATGAAVRCTAPNRSRITLGSFDPARQRIAIDLARIVAGTDLATSPDMMPGCMSGPEDPDCGAQFKALGLTWSADGKGTGRPAPGQTAFRVIAR